MPRLLKRQVNQLITYHEGNYEILSASKQDITADGTKAENLPTTYQHMVNVLAAVDFFRSLGGKTLLSYTLAPRTMDTIHLQVRSINPERTQETKYIFTIKFVSQDEMTKFVNLR